MPIHRAHRLALALALAALTTLAAVAVAQTPLAVPSHGFTVEVPDGWVIDDDGDATDALYFVTSPEHAGGLIIAAGPLDGPEAAAYQAEGLAGLADLSFELVASVPGVQRGDLQRTTVAGVDAAGFTYRGTELGGRFVYLVSGDVIVALGAIADADATPTMAAALDQLTASFRFVGSTGASAPSDPFVGTFAGAGLTLTLEASSDAYAGSLTFSGQTFPVQASPAGGSLSGSFVSDGTSFAFSLVVDGDTRVFTTGTSRYVLR